MGLCRLEQSNIAISRTPFLLSVRIDLRSLEFFRGICGSINVSATRRRYPRTRASVCDAPENCA